MNKIIEFVVIFSSIAVAMVTGTYLYIYVAALPSTIIRDAALTTDPKPYGVSLEQWSIRWWQWTAAIEEDQNPVEQVSASYLIKYQPDYPVYFLTGGYNEKINRTVTIPSTKGIFFPIFNGEFFVIDVSDKVIVKNLQTFAFKETEKAFIVNAELDGKPLPYYRVKTGLFTQHLPKENLFDIKLAQPIVRQAISDGYWVYLEPLPVGYHTIHLVGRAHDYYTEVTYSVMVMKEDRKVI